MSASDRVATVMVSSTYTDLKALRRILIDAAQGARLFPEAMEHDAARPDDLIASSLKKVRSASAYALLIAHRYGQQPVSPKHNPKGVSITELEFDEALRRGLPVLLFMLSDDYPLAAKHVDQGTRTVARLNAFRERVKSFDGQSGLHRVWVAVDDEADFRQKAERSMQGLARWLAERDHDEAGVQRERDKAWGAEREGRPNTPSSTPARQRVVNLAPQAVAELFKDRIAVAATLSEALLAPDNGARLITLFGPGGIGKTALACKVLRQLERVEAVHGLIYLSARTTGISFERIYSDSARMLGGAAERRLTAAWRSETATTASRIQLLLEAYGQQRCVILLDNLESVLDASGRPLEADLHALLQTFLSQAHGARLFATTREPVNLTAELRKYQKLIPLERGLPMPEAVSLLRDLDEQCANGDLGLLDAPEADLVLAAEKTQGFPTALEAIVGILSEDRQLSLGAILADSALFDQGVIGNLVQSALSRLDMRGHRVMRALAVFGRPVREVAVAWLLEPETDGAAVHEVLQRLTHSRYVNGDRATGALILHPLHREFCLAALDAEDRRTLERRAADYYRQQRLPGDECTSIRSLDPQLFEFEHRLQAGDTAAASEVLRGVDVDRLVPWGHARLVLELRGRLDAAVLPAAPRATHELALAEAALAIGHYTQAMEHAGRAGEFAGQANRPDVQAHADVVLGAAAWFRGDYRSQEERCLRALRWSRAAQDARVEIRANCGLADAYHCLGRMQEAVEHAKAAAALAATTGRQADEVRAQSSCGASHRLLGELEEARHCYESALSIANEQADILAMCRIHNSLALVALSAGRPATSLTHARTGLARAREIGSIEQEAFSQNYIGCAFLAASRLPEAVDALERGLQMFEQIDYRYGVGFLLAFLGSACVGLGDPPRALYFLQRGLAVAEEIDEARSAAYNLFQLARLFAAGGAVDQAVDAACAARDRFAAAGTPHGPACSAYVEALRCRAAGDSEAAAAALLQAARALLQGGDFAGEAHALAREADAIVASDAGSPTRGEVAALVTTLDRQLSIPDEVLRGS